MTKQNLVLLHGWGFNSSIWDLNHEYLSQHYNIHAVDLLGHGNENYRADLHHLDSYLAYLLEKIATKFTNFHILGWSLGGVIALNLKHNFPTLVDKVILCCSSPCFVAKDDWQHGMDTNLFLDFEQKLLTNQSQTIKEFLLLQTMTHINGKALYKQLLDIIHQSQSASMPGLQWGLDILRSDHRPLLSNLKPQDIKFLFGEKDLLVNKSLKTWLQDHYAQIEIDSYTSSGHMPFITHPDLFYQSLAHFQTGVLSHE